MTQMPPRPRNTEPSPGGLKPYTRLEITAAKFANACSDTAAAFTSVLTAFQQSAAREAAAKAAQKLQARERFAACRDYVRAHPDATGE